MGQAPLVEIICERSVLFSYSFKPRPFCFLPFLRCIVGQWGTTKYEQSKICVADNVMEHYGKRIKILHGCPLEGWPNRAWPWPSKPYLPKRVGWPCPVRSSHIRTPVQDFNSFSIILLHYQHHISKNWRPILPCYISRLSHSVFPINSPNWLPCPPTSGVSDIRIELYCKCFIDNL